MTSMRVAAVVVGAAAVLRLVDRARWWRRLPVTAAAAVRRSSCRVPAWWATVAADAGLSPARAWALWRAAAPIAAVAALVSGSTWPLVVGAAVVVAPRATRGPLRRRVARRIEADLPGAIDAVARSLRAGASLRQALADAAAESRGPLGDSLRRLVSAANAGIPLDDALREWQRTWPLPGVVLVVAALGVASETGGASALAVEGVAATLRRRQAAAEETAALSAQARASAVVLAGAPLAVCAFTVVSGGPAARFLLGTPVGAACLVAGLGLDVLGWWWMDRLSRVAASR